MTCPGPVALERAFPASASDELTRHITSCETCAQEWRRMDELASLVRGLPVEELSPERSRDVRNGVLARAASRPPASRRAPFATTAMRAAFALAAAIAAMVLFLNSWPSAQAPARARNASVVAGQSARFTHSNLPDETIRLVEGTVSLDVHHLAPGERMRVITGDAEVEVRGTSFVVEAHADMLAWVHVLSGRVEVRVSGADPVVLGALDHWRPQPVATATPALASIAPIAPPIPAPATSKKIATAATPPIPEPSATPDFETPYRAAWESFRRGDHGSAAAGFSAVASAAGPLASDAAYWHAVSLGRAGRASEARVALQEYLRQWPNSPQSGEASAMLGWLLYDANDLEGARRAFGVALRSESTAAVNSATEGLTAIEDNAAAR